MQRLWISPRARSGGPPAPSFSNTNDSAITQFLVEEGIRVWPRQITHAKPDWPFVFIDVEDTYATWILEHCQGKFKVARAKTHRLPRPVTASAVLT